MKTFQKSLIAAALVAGSFAAVAGTAGTTNLLFPYVTTQTGSFTFISILNQNGTGAAGSVAPLHFTYVTKPVTATNAAACDHIDGDARSTPNDLMQFEIQNKVDLGAAFGDTTSAPKFYPADGNNHHGMLIVNNAVGSNFGSQATYTDAQLYGEARIINTINGVVAAYSTDDLHTTGLAGAIAAPGAQAGPNFATAAGPDGGLNTKVISWFAEPAVMASWLAIPLATEGAMSNGTVRTNFRVTGAGTQGTPGTGGHYNNNEGFQSATATAAVTCFGQFNRAQLLGNLNASYSNNGGWGNLVGSAPATVPADSTASAASVVYKVETTNATGPLSTFVTRAPTL